MRHIRMTNWSIKFPGLDDARCALKSLPLEPGMHCGYDAKLTYMLDVQAFDDLLLVKVGGRVIYHGRIGSSSSNLVRYFEVSHPEGTAFLLEGTGHEDCDP